MKGTVLGALLALFFALPAGAEPIQKYTFAIKLITATGQEGPMTVMVGDDSPMSLTTPSGNEVHITMKRVQKGDRSLVEVSSIVDLIVDGESTRSALPTVYVSGPGLVEIAANGEQVEGQLKSLQVDLKSIEST